MFRMQSEQKQCSCLTDFFTGVSFYIGIAIADLYVSFFFYITEREREREGEPKSTK